MTLPTPPPLRDHRRLPNPAVCENGKMPCNEPYEIDGEVVGHCSLVVWPPHLQSRWLRRPGHPGKSHRITWWTK